MAPTIPTCQTPQSQRRGAVKLLTSVHFVHFLQLSNILSIEAIHRNMILPSNLLTVQSKMSHIFGPRPCIFGRIVWLIILPKRHSVLTVQHHYPLDKKLVGPIFSCRSANGGTNSVSVPPALAQVCLGVQVLIIMQAHMARRERKCGIS